MMQSAPAASSRAKGEKSSEGARLLRTKRYSVPGLSRVGGFSFAPVLEKSSVTGNAVCKIRLPLASYKRIYNCSTGTRRLSGHSALADDESRRKTAVILRSFPHESYRGVRLRPCPRRRLRSLYRWRRMLLFGWGRLGRKAEVAGKEKGCILKLLRQFGIYYA